MGVSLVHVREELDSAARPDRAALLAGVRAAVAAHLREDPALGWLADDDPLAELGLDSVVVIAVVARLERRYGIALSDDSVFAATTLRELTDVVERAVRDTSDRRGEGR
uniref:AtaPKS2 protein n=1 Tax=Saccharothrix mutabilis subsp. capreolus TaxID=66854 RepID=Q83W20_STRMP|nr:AtaPKS2 protein [Saccharothrix mutabilis subsp. capreolus]